MSVVNKKLLRTVLPPDWVEVQPSDRGYCYLYCIEQKYQQRIAYHLGAQPDWVDVLKCGFLKRTAILEKRKNKDGTYHVYPSSCGVTPYHLTFPPGAMVGNGPIINTYDIIETILLVFFGNVFLGLTHLLLAIERAIRGRSLGSLDFALYAICLLLVSPTTLIVEGHNGTPGETIDLDSHASSDSSRGQSNGFNTQSYFDDDEEYIPPIHFKNVDDEYMLTLDFDLPSHMLCVLDDNFRHKLLSTNVKRDVFKKYVINRCPQLEYEKNDLWLKQAIAYDRKLQKMKSDDYVQLAKAAVENANAGIKHALKSVGTSVAETASLTSEFVSATTNLLENTSKDTIKVLKNNENAITDSVTKMKGWTDKVVEASPGVDDVIDAGITTASEFHKFANVLTRDIRSGEAIAETSKSVVSKTFNEINSVTTTVYESSKNVIKQVHQDSFSSEQMSSWTRDTFYNFIELTKQSPKDLLTWTKNQEYREIWTETVEGVPWIAKNVGKSIAAPIMGAAEELNDMDKTWISASGIEKFKRAMFGDWSEFSIYEKKAIGKKTTFL